MPARLPKHSCDTHLHVFGDPDIYPASNPNALYQPPRDCSFAAMQRLHAALGIERAVLVQPTVYGTDHRVLHDVLKDAPKGKYRGVVIVDDSVGNAELQRLHDVGVRGARFNFGGNFKLAPSVSTLRRSLDRIGELGWFAKHGHSDYGVEHQLARVALLERYVPDRQARDRVLVDNPARFFGFDRA